MIYLTLFFEFFKIGLFAIGGGLVTVPFLFDLAERYPWFDAKELTAMIAVSESTPGPLGVNMATFSGFSATGVWGGIVATLGLVTPSVIVIMMIAKMMKKYKDSEVIQNILLGIRPAVLALILGAGIEIAKISFSDLKSVIVFIAMFGAIFYFKKSPIFYIVISAVIGIALKL